MLTFPIPDYSNVSRDTVFSTKFTLMSILMESVFPKNDMEELIHHFKSHSFFNKFEDADLDFYLLEMCVHHYQKHQNINKTIEFITPFLDYLSNNFGICTIECMKSVILLCNIDYVFFDKEPNEVYSHIEYKELSCQCA